MTGARPFATSTHSAMTPLLLVVASSAGALAGRADRHQPVRPLAELPGDMLLKRGLVDAPLRNGVISATNDPLNMASSRSSASS